VALLVVACSSSSPAAPTAAPLRTGAPEPTAALASGLPGIPGSFAIPSFAIPSGIVIPSIAIPSFDIGQFFGSGFHGAPDLEAKLPATICGAPAFKLSFPAGFAGGFGAIPGGLGGIFNGIGANTTFSLAFATANPASGTSCDTTVFAIQVQNGDPGAVLQAIASNASQNGGSSSSASIGGKNVTKIVDNSNTTDWYQSGDTLFGVDAPDDASAGAVLSTLP